MAREPVSQRDWDNAHLTNAAAAVDLHRDDPVFGYRF
jgi:putative transposase